MAFDPFARPPIRALALVAALFFAHVVYLNCVAEDAFIALRFARNLAHGAGLVWNPGSPPVEGFTGFLWVILCATAIALGVPAVAFAQALSVAAGGATLALVFGVGRALMGWPPVVALVPVGLLAVAGPFATWASSGMESTLFAFLILWATVCVAVYWRKQRRSALFTAAVALVLASLTRPEGVLIAAVLLGTSGGLALVARPRQSGAPHIMAIAVYAALFGAYFFWRFSYFGYPLPNTYYAKTGGGLQQVLRGGLLAYLFVMQFVLPLVPAILVALWEFGVPRVRRLTRDSLATWFSQHAFVVLAALLVVVLTTNNVLVGGDYMAMHRFFVPVLPFLYLLFGMAVAPLHARARGRQTALIVVLGVTAAATFFPSTALERSFFASPPQQHGNYRGVQIERWHVARLSVIGKFFDEYRRDASESLATPAIGAIGYYADIQVYDIHGLVDVHIAHMPAPPDFARHRAGHGRKDLPYTFSLRPTYVVFSRDLTPQPIELWRYLDAEIVTAVERDYVHQAVWLADAVNGEQGYFTFFERRDSARRRLAGE